MAPAPQPVQLTDVVGSLKRHWSVIVIMAIIGLVLGALISFMIPSKYTAETTVAVNPMGVDSLSSSVDVSRSVSMPTEESLATSRTVAAAAAKLLTADDLTPDDIHDSTSVDTPDGSLILTIKFTSGSARRAAAGANAVAQAYLATRSANATSQVNRLADAATTKIKDIQTNAGKPENQSPFSQRSLNIQADALGSQLAALSNYDVSPGQVVGSAEPPEDPSTPGVLTLGIAGLFLGILVGTPFALFRKEVDSEIGGVDGLHAIGDQIVLDGTKDTNRADTWDIAAFMLKIPAVIDVDSPFTIMVDSEESAVRSITPGKELVDALSRRGRSARFVDAGAINEGKISRGWPTDRKRESWGGEIIVIDTTYLSSDANKVALATRSDSVLLARSTTDDAAALRRLAGLLKSKSVDIALTALFPPRSEMIAYR